MLLESRDIILTEYVGRAGTLLICEQEREALRKRFSPAFLEYIFEGEPDRHPELSAEDKALAIREEVKDRKDVFCFGFSEGGFFSALWSFAEAMKCGMDIYLDSVPMKQETIEVCEVFEINPYYLLCGDENVLIACSCGSELVRSLRSRGVRAEIVGSTNGTKNRIIHQRDTDRFVTRPMKDEWVHYLERKGKIS